MTSDRGQSWANVAPDPYPRLAAGEAGLPKDSIVLLDQIRSIDVNRIIRYLGTIPIERHGAIFANLQMLFHED